MDIGCAGPYARCHLPHETAFLVMMNPATDQPKTRPASHLLTDLPGGVVWQMPESRGESAARQQG
jgi:hypothetical protein